MAKKKVKYYTTDEVAQITRVKKETVREWIRTDKIVAVWAGRSYLISEESLKTFLGEKHG